MHLRFKSLTVSRFYTPPGRMLGPNGGVLPVPAPQEHFPEEREETKNLTTYVRATNVSEFQLSEVRIHKVSLVSKPRVDPQRKHNVNINKTQQTSLEMTQQK